MHLLTQPLAERAELAAADLAPERVRADVGQRRVEELRSDDRAKRVAREVADGSERPVDVLQATLIVRRYIDAEVRLHSKPPVLRHLINLHVPAEECPLNVVSENDVERICHLVGLDADEAGRDAVVCGVEVVGSRLLGEREALVELGRRVVPELAALQHHPLPQQRLRLVHAHGKCRRRRKPAPFLRQVAALFVERVTSLVDGRTEALGPVLGEARRDAHVGRPGAACERVRRNVEATIRE
mmetsp:Transcript_46773/g.101594  ORF Transcript_46773/g.101594 Transcript_46773/m.101594 type:complete len:242 (+) Transcript_46773:326-1051(+)